MRYSVEQLDALHELAGSAGWELLWNYAEGLIKSNINSLLTVDATDTAKIAALQAEIRGLRRVFDHVKTALKEE